jgi:hypothetical protein
MCPFVHDAAQKRTTGSNTQTEWKSRPLASAGKSTKGSVSLGRFVLSNDIRKPYLGAAADGVIEAARWLDRAEDAPLADRYFPELALAWRAAQALTSGSHKIESAFLDYGCIAVDEVQDLTPLEALKQAREKAMRIWSGLKPKPAAHEVVTFGAALEDYLAEKQLAPATAENYRYNAERYLKAWKNRVLPDIGKDRAGVRWLMRHVTNTYGKATANQVIRLISAVYRWQRKQDIDLPECPTIAVEVHSIPARDWA